jgi:beta-1,4-N-acetylglucosaminyltransferase
MTTQICMKRCKIVFVESTTRVHGLSLSGKLLHPIADLFLVQWESLAKYYKRAKYVGFVI